MKKTTMLLGLLLLPLTVGFSNAGQAKAKGVYQVAQLEKLLIGKRGDDVLEFLGTPDERVTDVALEAMRWTYKIYDDRQRPSRGYQIHYRSLRTFYACQFCQRLNIVFKGTELRTATVFGLLGASDSISNKPAVPAAPKKTPAPTVAKPREISAEEFEQWVMRAGITPLGVSIFRRVEIRGSALYLWLRDPSFVGPNLYNFPEFADAFGKRCGCAAITYVGVDFSPFGAGEAIMLTFNYDPAVGRSTMTSGSGSNRD